jgi:uncharacterized protein YhbP (UPF0306 family)
MDERIIHFIKSQTCATICCVDEQNRPYCFNCFYAFDDQKHLLYFKSSLKTYHATVLKKNPVVAGTILPDKLNKLFPRGVQLQGEIMNYLDPLLEDASSAFHKKYPFALGIQGEVFAVKITIVKLKENKLTQWQR